MDLTDANKSLGPCSEAGEFITAGSKGGKMGDCVKCHAFFAHPLIRSSSGQGNKIGKVSGAREVGDVRTTSESTSQRAAGLRK